MNDLVDKAKAFATAAHGAIGQTRKYSGEPYINHPAAVVAILRGAGITDEATLAAAWLHDVVEDCPVALCEIGASFGADVETLVAALTDTPAGKGLNRAARKALDCGRLARADARAQTIKVADMIDNTASIVERDPDFAVTYMREKAALVPRLTRANKALWTRAMKLVEDYEINQLATWLEERPHA